VAGFFGLGHGMAFSFTLAEMHLSKGQLALSLLGFNVGIELVQILLVALALPALLVLAVLVVGGVRLQPWLRTAGALLTATAAAGWLVDRLGLPNPVARVADSAGSHTMPMLVALAVSAVIAGLFAAARARKAPERAARSARTDRVSAVEGQLG
jgi:hypothetical protein